MQTVNKNQQLIFSHHDWPQIISPPSSISKLSRSGVFLKNWIDFAWMVLIHFRHEKIFPSSIRFANSWKEKVLSWCPPFDHWLDVYFRILFNTLPPYLYGSNPTLPSSAKYHSINSLTICPLLHPILWGVFFGQGLSVGLELSPPPCFSEHMITPH